MDKTAIKNFAIWARNRLIESVSDRAGLMGITAQGIADPLPQSTGDAEFYDYGAVEPYMIAGDTIRQRQELVDAIRCKENETDYATAYQYIMEEVAYTWFNRLIAIRFMEVNDYLPSHLRVLSSESGKIAPDLVETPFDSDLEFTERETDAILLLKRNNRLDDLFRMLFIKQCNALNALLPGLFERTNDYTEVLLNISLIDQDGVIHHLVHDIPEDDFNIERGGQVEIIGWLYQYYNTEPKAAVFGRPSGTKIRKEDIPAATQLFTPDWIVRYMVQNSLGRLWVEGHPEAKTLFIPTEAERQAYAAGARDPEDRKWYYYLEEAEQEPEVEVQLAEIRAEHAKLRPEDIQLIDPCMGSGHILVYAFDVLMQIYESVGYTQREAAQSILTHNLYGLDIDDRAYQMAYFAVMMKARQYDRHILTRAVPCYLLALQNSQPLQEEAWGYLGEEAAIVRRLMDAFQDAKELGSLVPVNWTLEELEQLKGRLAEMDGMSSYGSLSDQAYVGQIMDVVWRLIIPAEILAQKYDVVVTNPPYMGGSNMNATLSTFVKKQYPKTKSDMSTVFMEKVLDLCNENGRMTMINIPVWMFLSGYEKLREDLIQNNTFETMVHPGRGIFGSDFGTTAFVIMKHHIDGYKGVYRRLFDKQGEVRSIEEREQVFLATDPSTLFTACQSNFSKIPGSPVAYWVNNQILNCFEVFPPLGSYFLLLAGTSTGDNTVYQRMWPEVSYNNISRNAPYDMSKRWYPCNSGCDFRKYTLNDELVIDWENDGYRIKNHINSKGKIGSAIRNRNYYFKSGITWNKLSSSNFGVRFVPDGYISDDTARIIVSDHEKSIYLVGVLCSKVCREFLEVLSPTMSFTNSELKKIPFAFNKKSAPTIIQLTESNLYNSNNDRVSFETSWDFQQDPLVRYSQDLWDVTGIGATMNFYYNGEKQPFNSSMELAYLLWKGECNHRFRELKKNEEDMNRIFIDIYGLQDELTPDVADKDVTVYCVVDTKEEVPESLKGSNYVLTKRDVVVNFISYAVGCMFGRYSLNREGLVFAGGDFDSIYWKHKGHAPLNENGEVAPGGNYAGISLAKNHYPRFKDSETWEEATVLSYEPDADNIIPICDENYFEDDITGRFIKFVEVVFGKEDLTANLQFIADALGGKGSARDIIRNYFLKDFFTDHCKRYQNRPIYWLFDSGKQNGFKALVYLHRYNPDTIGLLRVDYLHRMQKIYESEIERMQENIVNDFEVAKSEKRKTKMLKQLKETRDYDEKISHLALARTVLDLDDGVKVNYRKLQTAADGQFYEVLANSKKIIGKDKKKK